MHSIKSPSFILNPTKDSQDMRLDKYVSEQLEGYSRSYVHFLIESGAVTINTHPCNKPSTKIKEGDRIEVIIPQRQLETLLSPAPSNHAIEIIFQHPDFWIINKPAGLLVHTPHQKSTEPTLVDWIIHQDANIKAVGDATRSGIVHRLDKDTSGIIIIARTPLAHQIFSELFATRAIQKTYIALVKGHPEPSGSIETFIGRDPVTKVKMANYDPHTGARLLAKGMPLRHSLSHYTVNHYFQSGTSLVTIKPVTGRTHQIRLHMAYIKTPLLGDATYASESLEMARHALHASSISFCFQGQDFSFSAPLPADMQSYIDRQKVIVSE